MSDTLKCDGCGTPLANAGAIGLYCPNRVCDYEWKTAGKVLSQSNEQRERAEYERLKAKFT